MTDHPPTHGTQLTSPFSSLPAPTVCARSVPVSSPSLSTMSRFLLSFPRPATFLPPWRAAAAGTLPPLPPPSEQSDSSDGGPNLLGGAYDSSGDEDDGRGLVAEATTVAASISATTSSSASLREGSGGASRVTLPLGAVGGCERSEGEAGDAVVEGRKADVCASAVPDEAKRVVVDKMVGFVARNGRAFEVRVRER